MHRGVGRLLGRQAVSLAAGTQAEDEGVAGGPLADALASPRLRRVVARQDRLDPCPEGIAGAPDGRQRRARLAWSPHAVPPAVTKGAARNMPFRASLSTSWSLVRFGLQKLE